MLTSLHENVIDGDKEKPVCVIDYNSNMGGVDRVDMLLSSIESVRKTIKWYKKVFFSSFGLVNFELPLSVQGENRRNPTIVDVSEKTGT